MSGLQEHEGNGDGEGGGDQHKGEERGRRRLHTRGKKRGGD
jgi:hypothetical protein